MYGYWALAKRMMIVCAPRYVADYLYTHTHIEQNELVLPTTSNMYGNRNGIGIIRTYSHAPCIWLYFCLLRFICHVGLHRLVGSNKQTTGSTVEKSKGVLLVCSVCVCVCVWAIGKMRVRIFEHIPTWCMCLYAFISTNIIYTALYLMLIHV